MKTAKKTIHKFTFKKNDSLWAKVEGKVCEITGFDLSDDKRSLFVYHNLPWEVYTSDQFEAEVRIMLIKNKISTKFVEWSEQGLQEDGVAHFDIKLK